LREKGGDSAKAFRSNAKRRFSSKAAIMARPLAPWNHVGVSAGRLKVPYNPWEVLALVLWGGTLAVVASIEFSRHKPVAGALAIFLVLATTAWDWYAHRAQPEFFAERRASLPQAIAATLLVGGGGAIILLGDTPAVRIVGGLFSLAVIATVVADRTRELPSESVLAGREHLIGRAQNLGFAVAFAVAFAFSWFA
jgi:hypothetical protein